MSTIRLVRGPADAVDGVGDYCERLARALCERGHQVSVTGVDWHRAGRLRAVWALLSKSAGAQPVWAILQHTHLAWSRRGFPLFAVLIALVLKLRTDRLAVIIHDPLPFGGARLRDRLRRNVQVSTMRWLVRSCDVTLVTVPVEVIPWLEGLSRHVRYIPVGSNIQSSPRNPRDEPRMFEVVVFGLSPKHGGELVEIARVTRLLADAIGQFRLSVLGIRSDEVATLLPELLGGTVEIEIETTGVLPEPQLGARLARADALLFVRGAGISSRRGTALAGLAAGLPIVGYSGPETAPPLTEGGVVLTCQGDAPSAASALAKVARDSGFAHRLRRRSISAYQRYFAWPVVAEQMEHALQNDFQEQQLTPCRRD